MKTTTKEELKEFRLETRQWLEENCPKSMRLPIKEGTDYYWGGRNASFSSEDQKIWFEKMLEKKWIVPYWETRYGGGGLSSGDLQGPKIRLGLIKEGVSRYICKNF